MKTRWLIALGFLGTILLGAFLLSVPAANLTPLIHKAPGARVCSSVSLEPIPLEPEVQNGTTVTPVRSAPSRKVHIILGALPCHMG